ncbi:MAG: caspase family protein [Nitrospirae bacterium]|nr:caspase family protein [Nitrospirota bacterium]MBF0534813.1 caspase family protein [Nitrospirota bacterium]MBF0616487.1 caspase family protein [Nitrospirota bacterium]
MKKLRVILFLIVILAIPLQLSAEKTTADGNGSSPQLAVKDATIAALKKLCWRLLKDYVRGNTPSDYERYINNVIGLVGHPNVLEEKELLPGEWTVLIEVDINPSLLTQKTLQLYSSRNGQPPGYSAGKPSQSDPVNGGINTSGTGGSGGNGSGNNKPSNNDGSSITTAAAAPPTIEIYKPEVDRGVSIVSKPRIAVEGRANSEAGISYVLVDNRPAVVAADGTFTARDVLLKVGENEITVAARDINRQETKQTFKIKRKDASELPSPGKGNYYALLIGINTYQNYRRLDTAVDDVEVLAKILHEKYGFNTELLIEDNATKANIEQKIFEYYKTLGKDDSLLIYYAGHGDEDKKRHQYNWIPVDGNEDNNSLVNTYDLVRDFAESNSYHILLIADSCFSGSLTEERNVYRMKIPIAEYIETAYQNKSRQVITSGGNQPVLDGGGKGNHSVFASALIEILKKKGEKPFTAFEITTNLWPVVLKKTNNKQTVMIKNYDKAGHEVGGDFVFMRKQ